MTLLLSENLKIEMNSCGRQFDTSVDILIKEMKDFCIGYIFFLKNDYFLVLMYSNNLFSQNIYLNMYFTALCS